jgi:hypothetical protein
MVLEAKAAREKLKRPVRIPTTTDILLNRKSPGFIRPSDHVLVVGPGIDFNMSYDFPTIPMDRSLITLPPYLAPQGGRITILDSPFGDKPEHGDHNIDLVRDWLKRMSKIIPICPIEYKEADLLMDEIKFPSQFDSINDHLTTFNWILRFSDKNSSMGISRKIIDIYDSLLKSGGKIIMHYSEFEPFRKSALMLALKRKKFSIKDVSPLIDIYNIPRSLQEELSKEVYYRTFLDDQGRLRSFNESKGILIGQKK